MLTRAALPLVLARVALLLLQRVRIIIRSGTAMPPRPHVLAGVSLMSLQVGTNSVSVRTSALASAPRSRLSAAGAVSLRRERAESGQSSEASAQRVCVCVCLVVNECSYSLYPAEDHQHQ